MTTTRETCLCECQECLSLRAAAGDPGSGETVAAFQYDSSTYQIDHLGIGSNSQWGEFVVYRDDEEAAEFTLAESVLRPRSRQAGLPVSADELVWLARQALSRRAGRDHPPRPAAWPAPGTPPSASPSAPPRPARSQLPSPRRPRPLSTLGARQAR